MSPEVVVVGVGADGWEGLPPARRAQVCEADLLLGGHRHLDLVPSVPGQQRRPWTTPLRAAVEQLAEELDARRDGEHAGRRVVVLASGDPMLSGVGSTLVATLGAARVAVHPAVSSVALARARMGWSAESHDVVTLVGRDPHAVLRVLAPDHRVLVLSSDERTPAEVARLLAKAGYGASRLTLLGDLGAPTERRISGRATSWAHHPDDLPRLHVLAVETAQDGAVEASLGWVAGLPDEAFEHDGQLTRRDLRASALARLAPHPGALLWDVGAGAGSVGVEWMRAHPTCRTIAVESDSSRAERVGRNARALGVPALTVVTGRAPAALAGLPAPDAVFVGGGASAPGVLEACTDAVRAGGRVVVHAVTLETEAALAAAHRRLGGELTRIHVERTAPVGSFTGWTPSRAVTQWAWRRSREPGGGDAR